MVRRLLACWGLLACLMGMSAPPDDNRMQRIYEAMSMPGVTVNVQWATCGQVNAFYTHEGGLMYLGSEILFLEPKSIVLCRELADLPDGFTHFVFAHELAHAVIVQREIPYTGSHETAADELAAYVMSIYGMSDDVMAASDYFMEQGNDETPWDDHPGDMRRGIALGCIADGSQNIYHSFCPVRFDRIQRAWNKLLGLD